MNAGTKTARNTPLSFVAANKDQTRNAGLSADFQDLCSRAMDQALGIEKASLSTVVTLNSCVLDIYQEALRFNPVFGNCFNLAALAVASSIELQMSWLILLAPQHFAMSDRPGASTSDGETRSMTDDLAHSMDAAVGVSTSAPSRRAMSITGGQARRRAKVDGLERGMDIATGARAA